MYIYPSSSHLPLSPLLLFPQISHRLQHRSFLITTLPSLLSLDGVGITLEERQDAQASLQDRQVCVCVCVWVMSLSCNLLHPPSPPPPLLPSSPSPSPPLPPPPPFLSPPLPLPFLSLLLLPPSLPSPFRRSLKSSHLPLWLQLFLQLKVGVGTRGRGLLISST